MDIYTIGHSTHSIEEFISILKKYKIEVLVDVRSYPGSKYVPQFNKENMKSWVIENGIEYIHMSELGGRRKKNEEIDESLIEGWRKAPFRNYAAYTFTDEYDKAIDKVIEMAKSARVCYMCSEAVPWRCHRLLISNTLVSKGIKVHHIIDEKNIIDHELGKYGAEPVIKNNRVIYPKNSDMEDKV